VYFVLCIFSVLVAHFLPFSFGVFFAKRESGGWAKWRLALPWYYGLWVNQDFFTMCIYKHCFLPMLLVFAMKCCTKVPCPLPHKHYCCSLPSPVCLPHLLICTCLISSPIACPPSSMLCWCLLCFFSWYVTFLCDSVLAYSWTYFPFRS